ncbi:MAG: hypothetical protein V4692_15005 [Bdellovibrionota bacterium]
MKVLVYAPLAVLGHHFETDLEVIQTHLDKGDDVTVIHCEGALRPLDFMACKGGLRCNYCRSRRTDGMKALKGASKLHSMVLQPLAKPDFVISDETLSSIEGIKTIEFRGVDVGAAYASSLISDLRDPKPDMTGAIEKTREAMQLLAGLTEQVDSILTSVKPDLVYFFNGRFTLYRSLLRLCQIRKIPFLVHERGGNNTTYSLTENTFPHDIDAKHVEIESFWSREGHTLQEKLSIGSTWFENNARGKSGSWYSFVESQAASMLPPQWNPDEHNVTLFVSSEDEMAAVPGWEIGIFDSQYEAVRFILASFSSRPEFRFYVRIHPNLRGLKNKDTDRLRAIGDGFDNCVVIPPESEVSSYALLKMSAKTLTCGSTTGIEATYWERPSILIGKAFYMHLGATYCPASREELISLVGDRSLPPLPKENAIRYGYWATTIGFPFQYYRATTLTTGEFNGIRIRGNPVLMYAHFFFVLLLDLKKIMKGEYGTRHLIEKIKAKLPQLKWS